MNTHTFFSRFCHSPIPRRAAAMLVALALSSLASCGRKPGTSASRDSGNGDIRIAAAKRGDLGKVETLLKGNPDFVFSKDTNGWTPLHFAAARGQKDLALAHKAVKGSVPEWVSPIIFASGIWHAIHCLFAWPPLWRDQFESSIRARFIIAGSEQNGA